MLSRRYKRNQSYVLAGALLTSAAWYVSPANADASLDELKARVEKAQKENLLLKAEKLERENLTMKAEALEAENAALRKEAKVDKTPVASIPVQRTASASSTLHEAKPVTRSETTVASAPTLKERLSPRNEINRALDNIPKDDTRREMTAAYKASQEAVPVIVKQWQGIYAGINAGYGANDVNIYSINAGYGPLATGYTSTTSVPYAAGDITSTFFGGPVAGGQVGYNYEFTNHTILGAEADFDYADINNSHINNTPTWNFTSSPGFTSTTSSSIRTGLNWLGTVRMRLGYNLGNFLPYITGGFAYGSLSTTGSASTATGFGYVISPTQYYSSYLGSMTGRDYSSINTGWALGAGAEYIVASNWSVKGEYLYTSLAGLSGRSIGGSAASARSDYFSPSASNGPIFSSSTMGTFGIHQVRVGLNYHTDWLASKPAVTAKY